MNEWVTGYCSAGHSFIAAAVSITIVNLRVQTCWKTMTNDSVGKTHSNCATQPVFGIIFTKDQNVCVLFTVESACFVFWVYDRPTIWTCAQKGRIGSLDMPHKLVGECWLCVCYFSALISVLWSVYTARSSPQLSERSSRPLFAPCIHYITVLLSLMTLVDEFWKLR